MPLIRITLRRGKSPAYRAALADGVYEALRATFNVPEEDSFVVIDEADGENFVYSRSYMGIARGDDFVIVQITVSNTRTVAQKQALFAAIVDGLGNNPGVRREDIFINLVEVEKANWSFGNGIARYV